MNFWSLNTHFYLTIENRWFLDEKLQFETQDVNVINFCSLNTHFYLTIESRWFLAEKLQFETTDVKAIELFKTCLMLDVISFKKYIRSSFLSLNRIPSS